ncbi:hypothetical protein C3L33_01052, partial [Rhododendron williamsianum]
MATMSEWWHEGYLRKYYDKTYEGSSSEEENDEEEVNDEESSEEVADNCPPRPKKKKVPLFIKTRCSPIKFVALIRTLTDDQLEAIKAINPFHTLLDVKCAHLHRAFTMQLVQCFNPETCSIELRRGVVVPIIEEDVVRVLGMPIGDTPVPTKCLESHRQKIEEDFNGGFKGIEIFKLENVIREGQTDGRATKGHGRKAEGVGGSLFLLMVIYFDLNPLDVEIGKEPQAPIGLWTKELMDIRITKEPEDKPICIDMYKELMCQFVTNSKSLHQMDAAMGEPVAGSPIVGSPQDGPRPEPVEDEGHSPQFTENFELHHIKEEEEGDQIEERGIRLRRFISRPSSPPEPPRVPTTTAKCLIMDDMDDDIMDEVQSDKFSNVLRVDCDPIKVGYEVLKCDMLFLPVLQSEHWYCVCISLVESRIYILDSMKHTIENLEQLEQVDILQKNLFALLNKRRTRSHDCGIYVMKFVDRWDGRTYPPVELQGHHIPNIRKRLLLDLFMDENNKERDSILKVIPRR